MKLIHSSYYAMKKLSLFEPSLTSIKKEIFFVQNNFASNYYVGNIHLYLIKV